jgi:hypothetical protein
MMKATQRSLDRRAREDEAPRLISRVPDLASLEIAIVEVAGASKSSHRKHVTVASAPALFVIACGDPRCEDGGHDITYDVLRTLQDHQAQKHGEHDCNGQVASVACRRRIEYDVSAAYTRAVSPTR